MTSIIAAAAIITKLSVRFADSHILLQDVHRSVQLNVRTTWNIFLITQDLHEELTQFAFEHQLLIYDKF